MNQTLASFIASSNRNDHSIYMHPVNSKRMFHYHSNRMYSAQSSCKYDRLSILFYDSSYHIMHVVCDIQEVEFVRGESPSARDGAYDGANDRAID